MTVMLVLWEDDRQTVKALGERLFLDSGNGHSPVEANADSWLTSPPHEGAAGEVATVAR